MIQGEDCSHYQPLLSIDSSVQFAWCKSSEGLANRDPSYNHHRAMYQHANIHCGSYHFWRPGGDPVQQARHWRDAAGPCMIGDVRPMADVEVPGLTPAFLRAGFEEAERLFGCRPILYTYIGMIDQVRGLEDYDLNIAAYRPTQPHPSGFNTICWQNTNHGPSGGDGDLAPDIHPLLYGTDLHPTTSVPHIPSLQEQGMTDVTALLAPPEHTIHNGQAGPGWWIIQSDGGVRTYGDANFYGSYPGLSPEKRMGVRNCVGAANTPDGYVLIFDDGHGYFFGPGDE